MAKARSRPRHSRQSWPRRRRAARRSAGRPSPAGARSAGAQASHSQRPARPHARSAWAERGRRRRRPAGRARSRRRLGRGRRRHDRGLRAEAGVGPDHGAVGDLAAVADDGAAVHVAPSPMRTPRPTMPPAREAPRPVAVPFQWMTPSSTAPCPMVQPSPMTSGPISLAWAPTRQPSPMQHRRHDLDVGGHLGALADPDAESQLATGDRHGDAAERGRRSCRGGTRECCRRRSSTLSRRHTWKGSSSASSRGKTSLA